VCALVASFYVSTQSFQHADVKQLIAQATPLHKGSEDCYNAKIRITLEAILGPQFLVTDFVLDRQCSIQLLCNVHQCCIPGSKAAGA
jgi:hypothetical protein